MDPGSTPGISTMSNPYKPLYIEDDMKIRYEFKESELKEAVLAYLENNELDVTGTTTLLFEKIGEHLVKVVVEVDVEM